MGKKFVADPQVLAEARARLTGNCPAAPIPRTPEAMLHDLQVHQIELEMQNDELRVAQTALRESRDRYLNLYDFAPVGYLTLTEDGLIREINLTGTALLGQERSGLLQRNFTALVIAEDQQRWRRLFLNVKEVGGKFSVELSMRRGDGTVLPVQLDCAQTKVGAGETALNIVLLDISERKRMEQDLRQSEQRFHDIAQSSGDWIWEVDAQERYTYASDSVQTLLGYPPAEVIGKTPFDFMAADEGRRVAAEFRRIAATKQPFFDLENRVLGKGGAVHFTLTNGTPILDPQGNLLGYRGVDRDRTGQKEAEDELRIAAVAFSSQNGMAITDPAGIIQRVNPAFTRLTGYSAQEAVGQTMALLKSGRQSALFYQQMWESIREKGLWQGEIWNRRKNGNIFAEMLTITAILTPERGITHYVASFTDITANKEAEAEIHRLAYYDPLTKLPNRRLLQDRLGQAIAATARSQLYGAIFFIDLDNFKVLNDTRGHDIGDLLLVEVAERVRAVVREGDTVARQGGDEFVVLMENLGTDVDDAATLAKQLGEKLRAAIDRPFDLKGYDYHCRLSIGVGLFDKKESVENLFKHADLALYQAKNAGRNTLRFFDPAMQAALDLRSTLEAELRQALSQQQLRLYYQPQVDRARRVIGVEALLRWQHPERGLIPPDKFIPLAEDTGLILPIGRWVMDTACDLIKAWEADASTEALMIAVNVSARQFRQADFVLQVKQALDASGANPARLKLELTESLVLDDVEDTIEKMHAIKQLGISFAMDDFGTGYSSLSYLARLPLDQLKIDQSFVRNLPGAGNDETIARTIITMGAGLAMHVIAEGVETEDQLQFLEAHGCHSYQGYLFGRPLPQDDLGAFLTRLQKENR